MLLIHKNICVRVHLANGGIHTQTIDVYTGYTITPIFTSYTDAHLGQHL